MENVELMTFAAVSFAIISVLFWIEFQVSGCGYGGSNSGRDNWALRFLRKPLNLIKKINSRFRRPRQENYDSSMFRDIVSM